MYKRIYYLGLPAYVILLIISVVFYKERSIFVDISYHLFEILRHDGFAIQNFRFGAVITQSVPLLASKTGLSLDYITLLYSTGFSLYYLVCYLLCGAVFKDYRMALVLLCFNLLFVSDTFYWIQSELPQGIAFMITFLAFAGRYTFQNLSPWAVVVFFSAIFTIAFFHPLILFPLLYIFLFFRKQKLYDDRIFLTVLLCYLTALAMKSFFFKTAYDGQALGGAKRLVTTFPHYVQLYSNKQFLKNCLTLYYWIPLLSVGIAVYYTIAREWKKLLLFGGFMVAYLLLINVSYPSAETTRFYIENLYLPLCIFIALPLIFDLLPLLAQRKLAIPLMALVLVTGIWRIYSTHGIYSERLSWERELLHEHEGGKLIMDQQQVPMDKVLMTWGSPYEFWLLSTIEHRQTASVLISDKVDELLWDTHEPKIFKTLWGSFSYGELPARYFHFRDTVSGYQVIR